MKAKYYLSVFVALLVLNACTTTLVVPYNETLIGKTDAFYKSAALIIEEGRSVSPERDDDRSKIEKPEESPAHYSRFETKYNTLLIETEGLILTAIANDGKIDKKAAKFQKKVEELIDSKVASTCVGVAESFVDTSLTVKNYIDLKCIVTKWKEQHQSDRLTRNTHILKRANWSARKKVLFSAILAIQSAENFKKSDN